MNERTYRAFISYSHADRRAGERLFRILDGYRPPKELVGQQSRYGLIPQKLYPIFRDREEFATERDLSQSISSALERSESLVVLCSPRAAQSAWVNREVQEFVRLGRRDRIHVVIADANAELSDCYPPALAALGDQSIAADVRETGDGWSSAPFKIIAGILGVDFGLLRDRELARARARSRRNTIVAAAFGVLALAAGMSAVVAWQNGVARERMLAQAISVTSGVVDQAVALRDYAPRNVLTGLLVQADTGFRQLLANETSSNELRYAYGRLLVEFSRHYSALGDTEGQVRTAADAADTLFAVARSDEPQDVALLCIALTEYGSALRARGDLQQAQGVYYLVERLQSGAVAVRDMQRGWRHAASELRPQLVSEPEPRSTARVEALRTLIAERARYVGLLESGSDQLGLTDQRRFEELPYVQAPTRSVAMSPASPVQQDRVRASNLVALGDVLSDQRQRAQARSAYEEALAVLQSSPDAGGDTHLADQIVLRVKIGDVDRESGRLRNALTSYTWALSVARRLSSQDENNRERRVYVGVTLARTGLTHLALGRLDEAASHLRESISVYANLVRVDPDNLSWKRDLATTMGSLGDVETTRADYDAARRLYEDAHALFEALLARDQANTVWQRDLSYSFLRRGELAELSGAPTSTALGLYQASLRILNRRRAGGDPQWRQQRQMLENRIASLESGDVPDSASRAASGRTETASVRLEICSRPGPTCGLTEVNRNSRNFVRVNSEMAGEVILVEIDSAGAQRVLQSQRGRVEANQVEEVFYTVGNQAGRVRLLATVRSPTGAQVAGGHLEYMVLD